MKAESGPVSSIECAAFSPSTFNLSPKPTDMNLDLESTLNSNSNKTGNHAMKQCSGCGNGIAERFLLQAVGGFWHVGCLRCACCHVPLGEIGESCYAKSGMILCRNDYIRMFGNTGTCSGCKQSIPAHELVMRAQTAVYHVACFSCVICHIRLCRGDRYALVQGHLLCEHDFPKVAKGTISLPRGSNRTSNKG